MPAGAVEDGAGGADRQVDAHCSGVYQERSNEPTQAQVLVRRKVPLVPICEPFFCTLLGDLGCFNRTQRARPVTKKHFWVTDLAACRSIAVPSRPSWPCGSVDQSHSVCGNR